MFTVWGSRGTIRDQSLDGNVIETCLTARGDGMADDDAGASLPLGDGRDWDADDGANRDSPACCGLRKVTDPWERRTDPDHVGSGINMEELLSKSVCSASRIDHVSARRDS
jgi:hypothetical protein